MDRVAPAADRAAGLVHGLDKGLEVEFSFKIYFFLVRLEPNTENQVETAKKNHLASTQFALNKEL